MESPQGVMSMDSSALSVEFKHLRLQVAACLRSVRTKLSCHCHSVSDAMAQCQATGIAGLHAHGRDLAFGIASKSSIPGALQPTETRELHCVNWLFLQGNRTLSHTVVPGLSRRP